MDMGSAVMECPFADVNIRKVRILRKETFDAGATPTLEDMDRPELKSVSDDLVEVLQKISEQKPREEVSGPGRTVYHLDNGKGQPLCNCRGKAEYTSVSFADAETRLPDAVRTARSHARADRRRVPAHCSSAVKLSA